MKTDEIEEVWKQAPVAFEDSAQIFAWREW
jgi:hypothetical protein